MQTVPDEGLKAALLPYVIAFNIVPPILRAFVSFKYSQNFNTLLSLVGQAASLAVFVTLPLEVDTSMQFIYFLVGQFSILMCFFVLALSLATKNKFIVLIGSMLLGFCDGFVGAGVYAFLSVPNNTLTMLTPVLLYPLWFAGFLGIVQQQQYVKV